MARKRQMALQRTDCSCQRRDVSKAQGHDTRRFITRPEVCGTIEDSFVRVEYEPELLHDDILPRLKALIKLHRFNMRQVTRSQHQQVAKTQRKHLRAQYYKSRKRAHDKIFWTSGNDAGQQTGDLSAVKHPLFGLVSDLTQVKQAVEWHHCQQMAPAVPAHLAQQLPWAAASPTPAETSTSHCFTVEKRGALSSLAERFTRHTFDSCLRSAGNNKATGSDMLPNELLKHLPETHLDMLFWFLKLCWKAGRTPDEWKHSNTVLFHKKGDVTDAANYRPIALHRTLYKLWASIVTSVMQTYAEDVGMISDLQEGFRKYRDCSRQLQRLTAFIEDAQITKRNLFLLQIDFASAFTSIDHPRLLAIMDLLGMPPDAVAVVKDLYTDATTTIATTHGRTAPIRIQRGTVQGDTLSPFLFILFIEPLLRKLRAGARGYKCGSLPASHPSCEIGVGYADDLGILAGSIDQMQRQITDVEEFCLWSGMRLAPHKCLLTVILYGAVPHATKPATNWSILEPMLSQVRVNGQPVQLQKPGTAFKYLGVHFTLTLNWKAQYEAAVDLILKRGAKLIQSPLSQREKLLSEEQYILGALRHTFCVAPYNRLRLDCLDALHARIIKAIRLLPRSISTAFVFLPTDHAGLGHKSMKPTYAQVAAESMARVR